MSQNDNKNLEPGIPQQVPATPDQNPVQIGTVHVTAQWQSGPLPSPDVLREYEVAMPGVADRIFTMAEQSQHADIDYDSRTLSIRENRERGDRTFAQCGQVFGFATVVIFFSLLACSMWIENITMFGLLFGAGAFAGLAQLVRSYQKNS